MCIVFLRSFKVAVIAAQARCYGCSVLSSPTKVLRCNISRDVPLSVQQLRLRLQQQLKDGAPRMESISTEGQLSLTLARSPRAEERDEALERAESLWCELEDSSVPLPMSSVTGLRISLCTSMRRCALVSRKQELAEMWTERFAKMRHLRPTDFSTGPNTGRGASSGWRGPQPGAGLDGGDDGVEAGGADCNLNREKEQTPMQTYRQEVLMDHPMMQLAFKRGVHSPGPRYTGD
uniref:Uncharacterized protein TCIL3000_3_390 n=1 Tax=Trypanosoma congolense (strain IL3000) TaxID=1068625 RepID=G0UJS1_TRYCI|nr:unnamed protein product [Trypanosoma congolense IL3000]